MFTPQSFGDFETFGEPQKRSLEVSLLERWYRLEAPGSNRRLIIARDHTYHSLCDCLRCCGIRLRLRGA
jgi:hypothetical protein